MWQALKVICNDQRAANEKGTSHIWKLWHVSIILASIVVRDKIKKFTLLVHLLQLHHVLIRRKKSVPKVY